MDRCQKATATSADPDQVGRTETDPSEPVGRAETGSPQQVGRTETGSPQQVERTETGSAQQVGRTEMGSPKQEGRTETGSAQQDGRTETGSPQQIGRTETGSPQQVGRTETGSPQQVGRTETDPLDQVGRSEMDPPEQAGENCALTQPFECPVFRANLERASITECGVCVCLHCFQRSCERCQRCAVCNKHFRSHGFKVYERDSPDVIDALFQFKDKDIAEKDSALQESKKKIAQFEKKEKAFGKLITTLQHHNNDLIKKERELTEKLTKTEEELVCLKDEVKDLQPYVQLAADRGDDLSNLHDNVIPEKDQEIFDLQTQISCLSDVLNNTNFEVERLHGVVEQYVQTCGEQAGQLQDLWGRVIPEKDQNIAELDEQVAQLISELETLRSHTVFIAYLETISESKLGKAIQLLKQFYDREYRCRYEITERMDALLQTKVEDVMKELCEFPEIGDQLALVIKTYVSMIEENANLHRSLRTHQHDIEASKKEIRQMKANWFRMEKIRQNKYVSEE